MNTNQLSSVADYRVWRRGLRASESVGFVPTMGGLHEGHFALVKRAQAENDRVAVSIFLNRTQFNNQSDFDTYPARYDEDLEALAELGVDAVWAPGYDDLYPDNYRFRVIERELSSVLEGEHRPGHFDGVLTVVMKLLQVAQATRAYFGEKDWQQLQLVQGMAAAFFLDVSIVACPTERAASGLALSSRNRRLSAAGLEKAAMLHDILNTAKDADQARRSLEAAGFEVEYVAERAGRRLGAVRLEGVRLIDNVELRRAQ